MDRIDMIAEIRRLNVEILECLHDIEDDQVLEVLRQTVQEFHTLLKEYHS